jgi:hypothetical protein
MNRIIHAILLAVILSPIAAFAADPGSSPRACSVAVSGAVTAMLECKVDVVTRADGSMKITLSPKKLPKGVKAFIVGEFDLPRPAIPGSYPMDKLTSARIVLTSAKHITFVAERPKAKGSKAPAPARGEVTLVVETTRPGSHDPAAGHQSAATASGSYKARLAPSTEKGADVSVDVRF